MTATCPNGHTSTADDYCDVCGAPIDSSAGASAPVSFAPASTPAPHSGTGSSGPITCPHCGVENPTEALFCEACGYDFTTGTLPRAEVPEAVPGEVGPGEVGPGGVGRGNAGQAAGAAAVPDAGQPAESGPSAPRAAEPAAPQPPESPLAWVAEVWVDPDWYAEQESTDPMPSPGLPVVVALRKRSILIGRTSHSRKIAPDIACETDTGISRRQAQLTTDGTRWFIEDLDSANGTFVAPASGPVPPDPITVGVKRELATDDRIYLGAWTRIVVRAATDDEKSTL